MFSCHLPSLTSYKFLALISFSVLTLSAQRPQLFGIPFVTQSILPIHSSVFGRILKHTISKQLLIPPGSKLQCLDSFM